MVRLCRPKRLRQGHDTLGTRIGIQLFAQRKTECKWGSRGIIPLAGGLGDSVPQKSEPEAVLPEKDKLKQLGFEFG